MEDPMKKFLLATVAALSLATASAQVGKAASEATDAAKHKIDQKRADSEAEKSGPVGKVVNNVKSDYHKKQSQRSAGKAKKALKDAG
jgi:Ni/Co efflux regulator RcnB